MAKIKVRLKSGKLYNVKEAAFVEICNDENDLAALVYATDDGIVHICKDGDPEFSTYLRSYKMKGLRMVKVKVPEVRVKGTPPGVNPPPHPL